MRETSRRWAYQDGTLNLWPPSTPRQLIYCYDTDGHKISYSLSVEDSRLTQIRRESFRAQNPGPTRFLAIVHWRRELAEHYLNHTLKNASEPHSAKQKPPKMLNSGVMTVSHEEPVSSGVLTSEPDHKFWGQVKNSAIEQAQQEQQRIAGQTTEKLCCRWELGPVFKSVPSFGGWFAAGLIGFLVGTACAWWERQTPSISISKLGLGFVFPQESSALDTADFSRIKVPLDWLRFHQSPGVYFRRSLLAVLVTAALALTIASFLAS
jgi:hypothetical protein